MLTLRKILFPVDFSDQCVQAAPYVAGLARKFESELILLHAFGIYDDFAYGTASPTVVYSAYEDLIRQRRAAELESFACKEFEGLKVTRTLEVGEAGDAIAQYAHGHGIDLIVMPTHGRGRFRRLLLGSVTSKVLHDTTCPVWTTMHSELLVTGGSQDIHSILCAVDLGSETAHVIRAASDMAARCGAVVRLVHAITSPGLGRGVAAASLKKRHSSGFSLRGQPSSLGRCSMKRKPTSAFASSMEV